MSLDLFPPRAVIGYVTVGNQRLPVEISPEFYRALRTLVSRVGGTASDGSVDSISDVFAPIFQSAEPLFLDIVQPVQTPVLCPENYQTSNDNSFANETTYA